MRNLLASTGILAIAMTGSAFAADMPLKAPPLVAPAAFSWTGCYGGVNGGWIGSRTSADLSPAGLYLTPGGALPPPNTAGTGALLGDQLSVRNSYRFDSSSWEAGVQVGCQQQRGIAVAGFEADWQWSGLNGSFDAAYPALASASSGYTIAPHVEHVSTTLDWFSTFRARVGFTPAERVLLYGTAGFAFADIKSDTAVTFGTFPVLPVYNGAAHFGSASKVAGGVVAGAGAEWAFAQGWSAKAEFLYLWFEGLDYQSPLVSAAGAFAPGYAWNTNVNIHDVIVARIGINYRFWTGL